MRKRYRTITLALASLLPLASSFAADIKLVKAVSGHFELYTTDNEAAAKAALTHFETVRGYLLKTTNSQDPFQNPVRIVGFKSLGEFSSYRPRNVESDKAFAVTNADRTTIVMAGLKKEFYEYGVLQYATLFLDRTASNLPFWLRLGLSQLYSTLSPENGQISIGSAPYRSYRAGSMPDLNMSVLMGLRSRDVAGDKQADSFYATNNSTSASLAATKGMDTISNALTQDFPLITFRVTHMLMFKKEYAAKFGAFVSALSQGQDSAAAFGTVYGQSLTGVGQDLALYFKLPSHAVVTIAFQLEKPVTPQVSQLSPGDSAPILAELKTAR